MKKKNVYFYFTLLATLLLLSFPHSSEAQNEVLLIDGASQGAISDAGSATDPPTGGGNPAIQVIGFGHNLTIPIDPGTGQPGGKRAHAPLTVIKYSDGATPLLYQALVTNEMLNLVILKFFQLQGGGGGTLQHYFTIQLDNANLVDIRSSLGSGAAPSIIESLSFVYQRITWTNELTGAATTDSWSALP